MSLIELKKNVKNKEYKNIYLFYGVEEYLIKYYLNNILDDLLEEGTEAFNKIVFENKVTENEIMEAGNTFPVMSDKKVVVVKKSNFFSTKGKNKNDSKGKKKNTFNDFIKNIPEYLCLIFLEDSIDKRKSITSVIKKYGLIVEFDYQKPNDLVNWIIKVVKSSKKEINITAANVFIEYCELSMNEILNEINKVILYVGERKTINKEDVEKVCTKSIKAKIFDLIDSVAEKNSKKALLLLDDMINMKEPIQKIFILMSKQFINMYKIKKLLDKGYQKNEIASQTGINPYVVKKIMNQIRVFALKDLQKIIKLSSEIDISIKTGKMNDKIAIELLIVSIST